MIYNLEEEKKKRRAIQDKIDVARFWTDFTYEAQDYEYSKPTEDALYYSLDTNGVPSLGESFDVNRKFCGVKYV